MNKDCTIAQRLYSTRKSRERLKNIIYYIIVNATRAIDPLNKIKDRTTVEVT